MEAIDVKALQSRRAELGMNQRELAKRAGLHYTTLNRVERGHHEPSLPTLKAIAAALDLAITDLLSDEDPATDEGRGVA